MLCRDDFVLVNGTKRGIRANFKKRQDTLKSKGLKISEDKKLGNTKE